MIRLWAVKTLMSRTAHERGRVPGSGNILDVPASCARYPSPLGRTFRIQLFPVIEP